MTDLSKGIIEINGYEIAADTTPADMLNNLADAFTFKIVSDDTPDAFFKLKNISVLNRTFKIKTYFYRAKLSRIELFACCDTPLSFEEQFKVDCEWLKSLLGEPTQAGTNGVVYKFPSVQIGATLWESDGRSGPDEFIQISY